MRWRHPFRSFFITVCALLVPLAAAATTIVPADFADMVSGSQTIVHGRVVDVRAQATSGRKSIESIVTIAVLDAIKGPASARVVFRVPGGQIGRYRRTMVGAPEFAEGDEVVLFLSGRTPALPTPFGLSQGVYRVSRSAAQALVTPLLTERAGRVVRGDPARRPLTMDAFARRVRAEMERP